MDILTGVNYTVSRQGQTFGPYEGSQLIQLAQSGGIMPDDMLWTEGMADWVVVNAFTQLAAIFNAAATQGPVVQSGVAPVASANQPTIQAGNPVRQMQTGAAAGKP